MPGRLACAHTNNSQPNQVGFSYDTPTNGSVDLLTGKLSIPPKNLPESNPPGTFLNGTFSSQNRDFTANTTEISAMAIWHMLQGFLGSFPEYNPGLNLSSTNMKINLFAESYGGKYAPAFATLWNEQNEKIRNGTNLVAGALEIKLSTVGIVNGCVDDLIQAPYYPQMANNNTYGLQAISPVRAQMANNTFYAPGGCQESIIKCRESKNRLDADGNGDSKETNSLCSKAQSICSSGVMGPYTESDRSFYDIAQKLPDTFPSYAYLEYLNSGSFLEAIGSPVNYSDSSDAVAREFLETGDMARESMIPELAVLLADGVRVAFVYGDRDYICNWLGGEAISLAVAAEAPEGFADSEYAVHFPEAGYAPIVTNETYVGGVVRQYANLSFSRIYQAGHLVPAYQPETSFQLFARIIKGNNLSTGNVTNSTTYSSVGKPFADERRKLPDSLPGECYVRNIAGSCTEEEAAMIAKGQGMIVGGVFYDTEENYSSEVSSQMVESTKIVKQQGTATVEVVVTQVLTGMFTATAIPAGSYHRHAPVAVAALAVGGLVAWNGL